jgi:ABC-type uncharacterized transport system substrate-binding protein
MKRRTASLLVAAVIACAAVIAYVQTSSRMPKLGILWGVDANSPTLQAFRQALRELGWHEGRNITIEHRYADGHAERLPQLAKELVAMRVDVIAAGPTPPAIAARDATASIPIVMLGAADPVALGLVQSLARPGGNVTGLSWSVNLEIIGKELEVLREALPQAKVVAILWNSSNPAQPIAVKEVQNFAASTGLRLVLIDARNADEIERAYATMASERVDAVLVVADGLFATHRKRIAELEARHRLPSIHGLRSHVDAGGLIYYGPDLTAVYRRGAYYVDRILQGAKPADLPVEQPAKYDLVVNLKTAKALGLSMPRSLLVRADGVIE